MKYVKNLNEIVIYDTEDFNVKQTLECGQIFRFEIDENVATVYSGNKRAILLTEEDKITIKTNDIDFFEEFFDLKTDYSLIKNQLKTDAFLSVAVDYGKGIRIIKNNAYEIIISFIISANNNISRIKKSIEYLCERFGDNLGGYYSFPTLDQLKKATVQDFVSAGLGYRATQMFDTVKKLKELDIENIKTKSTKEKFDFLVSFKGIGEKVANCVLLFGFHVKDVFPVDTWINKVYNKLTNRTETDRKKITRELTTRYGQLSGYAQQYFFYYFRDNNIK